MSGTFARAGVGAVLAATLALAGCGQKGPLYLPEKGGAVVTTPATTPPAPVRVAAAVQEQPVLAAAPGPQSTAEPQPVDVAAPPKKSYNDEDQQTPK